MPELELDVLVPLAEVVSPEQGGAKGFHLAALARHGVPVPAAFVLPAGSGEVPGAEVLEELLRTIDAGGGGAADLRRRLKEQLAELIRLLRRLARGEPA